MHFGESWDLKSELIAADGEGGDQHIHLYLNVNFHCGLYTNNLHAWIYVEHFVHEELYAVQSGASFYNLSVT